MPPAVSTDSHAQPIVAALVTALFVAGPLLAFPDLLPEAWRAGLTTALALSAIGLALVSVWGWRLTFLPMTVLALALVASWATTPWNDLAGLRHFSGTALGLLLLATTAVWTATPRRLEIAVVLFSLTASAVLIVGLIGAAFNPLKFIGHTPALDASYEYLPTVKLALPGLQDGHVNANALGGTALLVLPLCLAMAFPVRMPEGGARLMARSGMAASFVAGSILLVSLSRTAWLAAALTLIVAVACHRRGRRFLAVATMVVALMGWLGLQALPENWRANLDSAVYSTWFSVEVRRALAQDAMAALSDSPLLGIGINQFHTAPIAAAIYQTDYFSHAHNTFLQTALDVGIPGLAGYLWLFGVLLRQAWEAARRETVVGRLAAGAGLSLVAIHLFGLGDAIALGAKVGAFQWMCAGLIVAIRHMPPAAAMDGQPMRGEVPPRTG
jgi:O-antigen ligase